VGVARGLALLVLVGAGVGEAAGLRVAVVSGAAAGADGAAWTRSSPAAPRMAGTMTTASGQYRGVHVSPAYPGRQVVRNRRVRHHRHQLDRVQHGRRQLAEPLAYQAAHRPGDL
jgi:hypothetical protein